MKTIDVYLHSDKETMHDLGEAQGFTGEALAMFAHTCHEVRATLEVDDLGRATIVAVDGRAVEREDGHRAAWSELLGLAIRELRLRNHETQAEAVARMTHEREQVIAALRSLCDVMDKHLGRYLHDKLGERS